MREGGGWNSRRGWQGAPGQAGWTLVCAAGWAGPWGPGGVGAEWRARLAGHSRAWAAARHRRGAGPAQEVKSETPPEKVPEWPNTYHCGHHSRLGSLICPLQVSYRGPSGCRGRCTAGGQQKTRVPLTMARTGFARRRPRAEASQSPAAAVTSYPRPSGLQRQKRTNITAQLCS